MIILAKACVSDSSPSISGRTLTRYTVKILLEAHPPVWTPKNADFSSKLKKIEPLIDAHQQILKNKNWSYLMQKSLKFAISSEFLVIRLQPKSLKVHCF